MEDRLKAVKLKVKKGFIMSLIGAGVMTGLSGCGAEPIVDSTLKETLEATSDMTYLDDVLDIQETEDTESIKENIIKIDEAMASYKWLDSIKIDDMSHEEFDEIPDSEKEKVQSYSVEEVKQLADMQLDSDISDSDKKKINKQLQIRKYMDEGRIMNGFGIMEEALKYAIKANVCDATGLEPEHYERITISPKRGDGEIIYINIKKPLTRIAPGCKNYLSTPQTVSLGGKSEVYFQMAHNLYIVQSIASGWGRCHDPFQLMFDSMDLLKESCYAGAKLKDSFLFGTELRPEKDSKEIKKILKAK